jgi:hypothetical protein
VVARGHMRYFEGRIPGGMGATFSEAQKQAGWTNMQVYGGFARTDDPFKGFRVVMR